MWRWGAKETAVETPKKPWLWGFLIVVLSLVCSTCLWLLLVSGDLSLNLNQKYSGENAVYRFEIVNGVGPSLGRSFLLDRATGEVWRYYANFNDKAHPDIPTEEGFLVLRVPDPYVLFQYNGIVSPSLPKQSP